MGEKEDMYPAWKRAKARGHEIEPDFAERDPPLIWRCARCGRRMDWSREKVASGDRLDRVDCTGRYEQ